MSEQVNEDRFGFVQWRALPQSDWDQFWTRMHVEEDVKRRLLRFARLMLFERHTVDRIGLPLSGVALLSGPPGTGKTSLVRGLANHVASQSTPGATTVDAPRLLFAEVNIHALPNQMLGESQRNVANLLEQSLPELAERADGLIVLIDELDGFAVKRASAVTGSDPVDVVRTTESALRGIDRLAAMNLPVVVFGTSNFSDLVDEALVDRIDLVETLPLPEPEGIARILWDSLSSFGTGGTPLGFSELRSLAQRLTGLSGREVRRLVFLVHLGRDNYQANQPLTYEELITAAESLRPRITYR